MQGCRSKRRLVLQYSGHSQEAQRDKCWYLLVQVLFSSFQNLMFSISPLQLTQSRNPLIDTLKFVSQVMIERTKLTVRTDVTVVIWKSEVSLSFSVASVMFQVGYRVQASPSHKTSTESVASGSCLVNLKNVIYGGERRGLGRRLLQICR